MTGNIFINTFRRHNFPIIFLVLFAIILTFPLLLSDNQDLRLFSSYGSDEYDFIMVIKNMFRSPYYDATNFHAGYPYGYPYFSLAFIITALFKALGAGYLPVIPLVLRLITLLFTVLSLIMAQRLFSRLYKCQNPVITFLPALLVFISLGNMKYTIHPDSLAFFFTLLTFHLLFKLKDNMNGLKGIFALSASFTLMVLAKTYFAVLIIPIAIYIMLFIREFRGWTIGEVLRKRPLYRFALFFIIASVLTTAVVFPYLFAKIPKFIAHFQWELREHSPVALSFFPNLLRIVSAAPLIAGFSMFIALFYVPLRLHFHRKRGARPLAPDSPLLFESLFALFLVLYLLFLAITTGGRGYISPRYFSPIAILASIIAGGMALRARDFLMATLANGTRLKAAGILFKTVAGLAVAFLLILILPVERYNYKNNTSYRAISHFSKSIRSRKSKIFHTYDIYLPKEYERHCEEYGSYETKKCNPDYVIISEAQRDRQKIIRLNQLMKSRDYKLLKLLKPRNDYNKSKGLWAPLLAFLRGGTFGYPVYLFARNRLAPDRSRPIR